MQQDRGSAEPGKTHAAHSLRLVKTLLAEREERCLLRLLSSTVTSF